MKKLLYFIMFLIALESCHSRLMLTNKTYECKDDYKIYSLRFISDSSCVYTQEFLCDINEHFKKTEIYCTYQVDKKSIILKDTIKHPDSIKFRTFKIPEKAISKCDFFNEEMDKDGLLRMGSIKVSKRELYGNIDNIINDTLLHKRKSIIYARRIDCNERIIYVFLSFNEQ